MKKIGLVLGCLLLCLSVRPAFAKGEVTWSAHLQPGDVRAGEGAQLVVSAHIKPPWHLYSLTQPAGGPIKTTLTVLPGSSLLPAGNPVQPAFKRERDKSFNINIEIYERQTAFGVPVMIKPGVSGRQQATLKIRYMVCSDRVCLPPDKLEIPVTFTVTPGPARAGRRKPITRVPSVVLRERAPIDPPGLNGTLIYAQASDARARAASSEDAFTQKLNAAKKRGVLPFLGFSALLGFAALLTPCVFPMVPITVSFFTKRREGRATSGIRGAVAYCLGIIGTFTGLGVIMTLLFGAGSIGKFAANPYVNLALAALFLVMAANLLGAFEIALPSGLVNKAQSATRKEGLVGPLMMGLTFTLTSFTCTTAFVGTVLASAAQGNIFYPVLGMLAFSTAFASPFFLLALFPQFLARLPKSGSWLVTVKAFMGFLEIAAAFKFLSNADLVWQKGWLTQAVFLAVWAAVSLIAGLYLLGWLRLPHDDAGQRIGPMRRILGIATAAFGLYCFAAIQGAPLGELNAFVPPSPYPGRSEAQGVSGGTTLTPAAEEKFSDYAQALARAKAESRPLFVDFTGVTCTNCRWMEQNMFPRPEVVEELKHYVRAELYTDRDTPADDQNKELQQKLTGVVTLPDYVLVSPEGKVLKNFQGVTRNSSEFVAFLHAGRSPSVALSQ